MVHSIITVMLHKPLYTYAATRCSQQIQGKSRHSAVRSTRKRVGSATCDDPRHGRGANATQQQQHAGACIYMFIWASVTASSSICTSRCTYAHSNSSASPALKESSESRTSFCANIRYVAAAASARRVERYATCAVCTLLQARLYVCRVGRRLAPDLRLEEYAKRRYVNIHTNL